MSRSNPNNASSNPCSRWFEWKGKDGHIQWFDKEKKENVIVKDFTFLLLDNLSTITGWNKKANSGIYSNEVRDTRKDKLHVKLFSGETIAEGLWADIKEKVAYAKGKFAASLYLAYKDGEEYKMGNFRATGCALGPWFDFYGEHRRECGFDAITVKAGAKDTSGDVEFVPPIFALKDASEEADEAAKKLDVILQGYLQGYLTPAEPLDQTPKEEEGQDKIVDETGERIPF